MFLCRFLYNTVLESHKRSDYCRIPAGSGSVLLPLIPYLPVRKVSDSSFFSDKTLRSGFSPEVCDIPCDPYTVPADPHIRRSAEIVLPSAFASDRKAGSFLPPVFFLFLFDIPVSKAGFDPSVLREAHRDFHKQLDADGYLRSRKHTLH